MTTKTAHVTLNIEAAVTTANAGTMRADMTKAVSDTAKGEWRLTAFNRSQDQTGMERWSVSFEARLPEPALSGLSDAIKKASKPGMQITVGDIDFSPTLDETEAARAALRLQIFKQAGEQLASLNNALPGRTYRIAQINFDTIPTPPHLLRHPMMMAAAVASTPAQSAETSSDHAQKMTLNAHIVFAAVPPTVAH